MNIISLAVESSITSLHAHWPIGFINDRFLKVKLELRCRA